MRDYLGCFAVPAALTLVGGGMYGVGFPFGTCTAMVFPFQPSESWAPMVT